MLTSRYRIRIIKKKKPTPVPLVTSVSLQDGPEVFQLVEEVPDVLVRALFPVRVQVGELRVVAVAVERLLRFPLDEDQHLARRQVPHRCLAELAQGDHAPAVRSHFPRRLLRVGQVLVLVGDVEEVEGVDGVGHQRDSN